MPPHDTFMYAIESLEKTKEKFRDALHTTEMLARSKEDFLRSLVVKDVYEQYDMHKAIKYGMLDIVKYINSKSQLSNTEMIDLAIEENQVYIVKFFHSLSIKHSNRLLDDNSIYGTSGMLKLLNTFPETEAEYDLTGNRYCADAATNTQTVGY